MLKLWPVTNTSLDEIDQVSRFELALVRPRKVTRGRKTRTKRVKSRAARATASIVVLEMPGTTTWVLGMLIVSCNMPPIGFVVEFVRSTALAPATALCTDVLLQVSR